MSEQVTEILGYFIYASMALVALWGLYCVVMVWGRVKAKRFRSEAQ